MRFKVFEDNMCSRCKERGRNNCKNIIKVVIKSNSLRASDCISIKCGNYNIDRKV